MKLLKARIVPNCDIMLIGDTHEGSAMTHLSAIDDAMSWIMKKRNRYYIHMGDAIEAITSDDKRFSMESSDHSLPQQQADSVIERHYASRKRCLVWLYGNHEHTLHRVANFSRYIASQLGVPYGTWTCKLALDSAQGRIGKMFLCHGSTRGTFTSNAKDWEQQQANMKASLKRSLVDKAADCILMACGHSHKLLVVPPAHRLILSDDGERLRQSYLGVGDPAAKYIEPDRRWYVNTGCLLRLYGDDVVGYGERAGYNPVEIGYALVHIRKGRISEVERVVV